MVFPDPRVELRLAGVWTDQTDTTYVRNRIHMAQGRADEGARVDPGTCALEFDNRTGAYSPRNPRSDHFGVLGRNTPLRVTVPGVTYLECTGATNGTGVVTPDAAGLDLTGDLDVRVDATLRNWATSGVAASVDLAGKHSTVGNNRSWLFQSRDGRPYLEWSPDGVNSIGATCTASPSSRVRSRRMAWRAALDADNGAGGWTVVYFVAPTMAGPWTVLDTVTGTGTTSIYVGTAELRVGSGTNIFFAKPDGQLHGFELRSGDGLVAEIDFADLTSGTTSWNDGEGNPWTVRAASTITDRHVRFCGEVSEWPPRWDVSGKDVSTPVTAAGILRRLGQGARPLQSTLRRQLPALNPAAYWPMEEEEHATQAASPIAGVQAMFTEGLSWAAVDSLPSSGPLPTVSSNGQVAGIYGVVPAPASTLSAWQMQYVYRMDQLNATPRTVIRAISAGTVAEWLIELGATQSNIRAFDSRQQQLFVAEINTGSDLYRQWIHVQFVVAQEGGNVRYTVQWTDVGGDAGEFSDTFAGTIGRPVAVGGPVGGYHADMDGLALGHISVWHTNASGQYAGAIDAWSGETAAARLTRLAVEEDLPLTVLGAAADTERVGAQSLATLLDLLGSAADADGGILCERQDLLGLVYRPRRTLNNQPPALELDYAADGEVAPPLDPVDDDQRVRNDVTVQRDGGSSARAVREDGPLSTAAPPDGVGLYAESVKLSLADDQQAAPIAAWRLHLGTWDAPRYPAVHVNLAAAPHLAAAVCQVMPGDRITISNPPPWLPPETIDLLVMGWSETIGVNEWDITFNCVPGAPWQTATVFSFDRRVSSSGSELDDDVDTTTTTIPVAVTAGRTWVRAAQPLNADPSFEDGIGGWVGIGAELDLVEIPSAPGRGPWVLRITPDGLSDFPRAESEVVLVDEGVDYTVSAWMLCSVSRYVELNVNIFDQFGVYQDTLAVWLDAIAGRWMWVQGTVTVPAGGARATIAPTEPPTANVDEVLYLKQVTLRPTVDGERPMSYPFDIAIGGERMTVTAVDGDTSPQDFTVRRSANGIAKSHTAGSPVVLADPAYIAL